TLTAPETGSEASTTGGVWSGGPPVGGTGVAHAEASRARAASSDAPERLRLPTAGVVALLIGRGLAAEREEEVYAYGRRGGEQGRLRVPAQPARRGQRGPGFREGSGFQPGDGPARYDVVVRLPAAVLGQHTVV